MTVVGVNGFGRIGRCFVRKALANEDISVALVNDLAPVETLAHLFKYDSIHGMNPYKFHIENNSILFENGKKIIFSQEKSPSSIQWGKYNVETVIESTGFFRTEEQAAQHLTAGTQHVIISAPASSPNVKTIVIGVNDHLLSAQDRIVSNASCTTNNIAPMFEVMRSICEIEYAFITTVHSYTSDQRLQDAPHEDLRRARAATQSMIPTSTGAAKAITKIFPQYEGRIGGGAVRVPVANGSLSDITMTVKENVSTQTINEAMKRASEGNLYGIIEYTEDPIVSSDIVGNSHSCIFDAKLTSVVGKMVKIIGWYDNEMGYSTRLVELAKKFKTLQ